MSSNNSKNIASLLKQEDESPTRKQQPRGSNPRIGGPQDDFDNPAFRISRKKKDPSEADSEIESFQVMSPQVAQQSNLQRAILTQAKRVRKLAEELQTTRARLEEIEYRLSDRSDGSRESFQMMRGMQQQCSNEIALIKSSLQQRRIEEHSAVMKEKQKATALFLEMVRLGDAFEKMQDNVKGLGGGMEQRLQYLQGKIMNSDKNMMTLATRNSTGSDMMTEFVQKIMARIQAMEGNLVTLGREHMKDKEQVTRIDSSTSRIAQDLNVLLRNTQSDLQYKLQNRVSEMVNKMMYEKEDRVRAQDQIRKNLDFRQRLLVQKQRTQKEQLQSKYLSMDTNVRNQFMRKDQSIKGLQDFVESEVKSLQRQIQETAKLKDESEFIMKTELKKVQEGFRKEYDMHKHQQHDFVTNMQEMIKVEIGARLNSDVDLKNLTNSVATYLATDLNSLKEAFNRYSKETTSSLKQLEFSSSNRDSQLSHYVDQQISESMASVGQKYNKMKTVFTKLTQQFRTHLLTTEANRKSIDLRLGENEKDFDKLREEVSTIIDDFHRDFESKLKDEKENSPGPKETESLSRINKLEEFVNYNIETIKEGLQTNKDILTTRLETLKAPESSDIRELTDRVGDIKHLIEELRMQNQAQSSELKQIIAMNEQKASDEIDDLRQKFPQPALARQDQSANVNREFDYKMLSEVEELKTSLRRITKEAQLNLQYSNNNFKKIHEDMTVHETNITELDGTFKGGLQNMEEQIAKVNNQLLILQGEVKASEEVVREDIQRLIHMMEENTSRISTP